MRQRALVLAAREVELEQRLVRRQALAIDGERALVVLHRALLVAELVAVDPADLREHAGALLVLGPQLDLELERLDDARPVFPAEVEIAQAVDGRQARRRRLDRRVVVADRVVLLAELRLHDGAALEVEDRLLRAVVDDADLAARDLDELGPLLGAFVDAAERLERLFVRRRDVEDLAVVLDRAVGVAQALLAHLRDAQVERDRLVAAGGERQARASGLPTSFSQSRVRS